VSQNGTSSEIVEEQRLLKVSRVSLQLCSGDHYDILHRGPGWKPFSSSLESYQHGSKDHWTLSALWEDIYRFCCLSRSCYSKRVSVPSQRKSDAYIYWFKVNRLGCVVPAEAGGAGYAASGFSSVEEVVVLTGNKL